MTNTTAYIVTNWTDTDGLMTCEPEKWIFEDEAEAYAKFESIDVKYQYDVMYKTAGWRSMRGKATVKEIGTCTLDEDGEIVEVVDSLDYEEYAGE